MKKNSLWTGILAVTLVFGMTVTGCDNGSSVDTTIITLIPKTGYYLPPWADFFTVAGATSVNYNSYNGVITAVFPRTAGTIDNPVPFTNIDAFSVWLAAQPADTYYSVKLNVSNLGGDSDTSGSLGSVLYNYNNRTKYVSLDLSGSTFTSIENSAFSGSGLISITIPASVTTIELWAFSSCTGLTAIYVDSGNTTYTSENGVLYNKAKTMLIRYPRGKTGDFTIPNSVTTIEHGAFSRCTNLTGITIPNSVTSIGEWVFENCTGLTSITIPGSVTSIGQGAFGGCTGLASVTILYGVPSIGFGVFQNCTSLTSITIPGSVTSIEGSAFTRCTSLTSVSIPDSVISIGSSAFEDCSSLTSITIPNSVTYIDHDAFYKTAWLNNQPDGVIYAGKVVYIYKGTMPANTSITLLDGTKGISGSVFSGRSGLTSVTIPNSVNYIGWRAFYCCSNLTSVTIGNSVSSIAEEAFYGCSGLTSVTIPGSVTSIWNYAFVFTRLTSVTFATGSNIANFGVNAFPQGSTGSGGDSLKIAYSTGKAGTYTRPADGTWTKQL